MKIVSRNANYRKSKKGNNVISKNKFKKSFRKLNNQFAGECVYQQRIQSFDYLPPEEKISIRNQCFQIEKLYEWVFTKGNQNLPYPNSEIELTQTDKDILQNSYNLLLGMRGLLPQNIINKEKIIYLINKYPELLTRMLLNQYSHMYTQQTPYLLEKIKVGFTDFTLKYYKLLKSELETIKSQNRHLPITVVTIGNTPYKFFRLIELFGKITNINFIYLPYSGNFKKKATKCTCGTTEKVIRELQKGIEITGPYPEEKSNNPGCKLVETQIGEKTYQLYHWNHEYTKCDLALGELVMQMIDLEKYLENNTVFLQNQYTPEQLYFFDKMIIDSGLKRNIDDNHKIVFVDILQSGYGCLSFLMTIDKYLKHTNTLILGLESPLWRTAVDKTQSSLVTNDLILNKFPIKFVDLEFDEQDLKWSFFTDDENTSDRCVKSYSKKKWSANYNPYWEKDINNCNIALLNMVLILKENKLILN